MHPRQWTAAKTQFVIIFEEGSSRHALKPP
jgi:hypothetical protein